MNSRHRVALRLLPVVLMVLFLSSLSSASASPQTGTDSRQNDSVASLDPIQGLVQYRAAGTPDDAWETVSQRQLVAEGDWIRADGAGLAELTFFEGVLCEILPNTQVQVTQLSIEPAGSVEISLDVLIGDTHNRVDRALDAQSHYEIHTPSAIIAVRGTDFWASASWQFDARVSVLDGVVSVTGLLPDGQPGQTELVERGKSIQVTAEGGLGPIEPITILPEYPLKAPLAPASCGDDICQPGESEVCPLDCQEFPACGDQICDLEGGEGPVTCAVDCLQARGDLPPATTGLPCTVLANQRVRLYVGPGEHRAVLGYLNTGQTFPVVEQSVTSGDLHWWRIDMLNVAQAWVNQTGITTSGDCALLPMVEAAPYVPPPPSSSSGTVDTGPVPTTEVPESLPAVSISFFADRTQIKAGECVTLRWDVEGIQEVYYQGAGVVGHSEQQECPGSTTTYLLQVLTLDGQTMSQTVTVNVESGLIDSDGDTVPDSQDSCPSEFGPPENYGCPLADYDGDQVPDQLDSCPDIPGPSKNYGCPFSEY